MNRPLQHGARTRRTGTVWPLIRGLGAVVVLVALLGGVPYGLLRFMDWPITGIPTWDQIRDLPTTAASDALIIGVCVVTVWTAWLVFTLCVALEAAAQIRGHAASRLPAAGVFQHSARSLVASVAMTIGSIATLSSSRPAVAQTPAPIVTVDKPLDTAPGPARGTNSPATASPTTSAEPTAWAYVTVGPNDTAWDLAERVYGDGVDARRLWEDNRDQLQPDGQRWSNEADSVEPGWVLRIRGNHTSAPDPERTSVVTVQPGDSLWSIAVDHLGHQLGRSPTPDECAAYWQSTVDTNRDRIASGDPNLIYPGEDILLPPIPDHAVVPAPTPGPPADQTEARPVPALPDAPTPGEAGPSTTIPQTEASTSTTAPPSTDQQPQPAPTQPADDPAGDSPRHRIPGDRLPVGVGAALAALTLHALARRRRARRRSARPDTTTPARTPEDIEAERELSTRAADTLDRVWWAVRELTHAFRALADPPTVTGVIVDQEGDVTVHLSGPVAPVTPFVHGPSPDVWRLSGELEVEDRNPDDVPVLETLVAIGNTDNGELVLLDLESHGAIWIDGPLDTATGLLRSIVAELALQPFNHYVDMILVGDIDAPHTGSQGLVTVDHLDETMVRQIQTTADETAAFLAREQVPSTTAGRAQGLPRDALASVVVAVDHDNDPILLDRLANTAVPGGLGLTVITVDPLDERATQLITTRDGTVRIPHLGVTVRAPGLLSDDVDVLDDFVLREPDTVSPAEEVGLVATVDGDAYEEPAWTYCVRVFADLRVDTRDSEPLSFRYGDNPAVHNRNTSRGPELLAYLALQPDRAATFAQIHQHLWWGKQVSNRTVEPLITGTRQVLGGTTYLSHAQGRSSPRRYELGPSVVTDVDLLTHVLDYAHAAILTAPDLAAAVLQPHLAALEAPAFRDDHLGAGLAEWAQAARIFDHIEQPVINAALLHASICEAQGPAGLSDALWALDQALKVCPTNEALARAAMETDAKTGDREAAQRRYLALATELARDDLEPEPETTELRKRIMTTHERIT